VAQKLRNQGFNAFAIAGGLAAWKKSGLPTEQVPERDVIALPVFG
jgi:rhodanese-related sulfurtransferase